MTARQNHAKYGPWRGMRYHCLAFAVLALLVAVAVFYTVSAITKIAAPETGETGPISLMVDSITQSRLSLKISGRLQVRGKDLPQSHIVLSDGKTAYILPTKVTHRHVNRDTVAADDAYSTIQSFQSRAIGAFLPKGTYTVLLRYKDLRYSEMFFATDHVVTLQ